MNVHTAKTWLHQGFTKASPRLHQGFTCSVFLLLFAQFGHVGNTPLDSTSEAPVPSTATFDSYQVNTTVLSHRHPSLWETAIYTLNDYVIPTIAALGLCGNVLVLVVWSAEPLFNAATFFMKALAVSDIFFVVSAFYVWQFPVAQGTYNLVTTVFVYSRAVSAYTTAAIVLTRWLAVHKPTRVRSLLTKRNVVVSYLLVLLWCSLILMPFFLQLWEVTSWNIGTTTTFNISDGACVGLPIVVVMFLNVSLVSKMCGHRSRSGLGQHSTASVAARSSRFHGLLVAVVCLSVTTILAYPLGFVVRVFLHQRFSVIILVLRAISGVLEVLNSSINVVYYLLFASQFRRLLRKRFGCSSCCRNQP